MQTSSLIRNLRLAGMIIGLVLFVVTTVRLLQASMNVEAIQHSPLAVRIASRQ